MNIKPFVFVAAAAVIGTAAGFAGADTVSATFNGVSPSEGVSVVFNGNGISTTAGAFNWTRTGGSLAGFTPTFTTFCIDLTQYVSNGSNYNFETYDAELAPTSAAGPMGSVREAQLGRMFALYYSSLTTASEFAGFQLAVWEIALDGDMSLNTGLFTVGSATGGALSNAATYLTGAATPGAGWAVFAIDDVAGSGSNVQGQLMIPTPGTAALMGLGGLAMSRRRRV